MTEFLWAKGRAPFAWGENDCMLFAAQAMRILTGIDVAGLFEGKYKTVRGALRLIKRAGFPDQIQLIEGVTKKYRWPETAPALAQRADWVLAEEDMEPFKYALGIVDLSGRFGWFVGAEGLQRVALDEPRIVRAWRIG